MPKFNPYMKKTARTRLAKRRARVRKAINKKRQAPKLARALRGSTAMPRLTINRVYDGTPLQLKASTQADPGFWINQLYTTIASIPNISAFTDTYRFVRIKKFQIEYTPATRSDEYAKLFVLNTGGSAHDLWLSHAGSLEMKQLIYDGYMATPTTWAQCLNRAGKLKKVASVKSFRRTIVPKIQQVIEDFSSGIDPTKAIKSPWLSTSVPNNMALTHYLGYDCFHTLNNISFDNDCPLYVQHRYAVQLEFKGFKV